MPAQVQHALPLILAALVAMFLLRRLFWLLHLAVLAAVVLLIVRAAQDPQGAVRIVQQALASLGSDGQVTQMLTEPVKEMAALVNSLVTAGR